MRPWSAVLSVGFRSDQSALTKSPSARTDTKVAQTRSTCPQISNLLSQAASSMFCRTSMQLVGVEQTSVKVLAKDGSPQPAQAQTGRGILNARNEGVDLVVEAAIGTMCPRVGHLHRSPHARRVLAQWSALFPISEIVRLTPLRPLAPLSES